MYTSKWFRSFLLLALALVVMGLVGGCESVPPTATPVPPSPTPSPTATVAPPKKAVLLFSYEPDFWATLDEDAGVVEGLSTLGYVEGENIEITRLYMKTKTVNKTQEQMEAVAQEMLSRIAEVDPDVLFIMDDNGLQHVGAKLLDTDLPIVFAGINGFPTDPDYGWLADSRRGPLADSLEHPGHNVTGVLERISFTAGFELLHKIRPEAKTALFITDDSAVGNLLIKGAGGEVELARVPLPIVDEVFTNDFEVLKSTILEYQDKVDAIVLFLPWTIEDKDGQHVPQDQVVGWMLRNNLRPGIGFLDILVEEGYLCGVVVDMNKQGFHAGVMGGRILNGEKVEELPIVDPVANRIMINLARADQLGIDVPFEVLKSADVVFREMTSYPEYKMSEK